MVGGQRVFLDNAREGYVDTAEIWVVAVLDKAIGIHPFVPQGSWSPASDVPKWIGIANGIDSQHQTILRVKRSRQVVKAPS